MSPGELRTAQRETLAAARRPYALLSRMMFGLLDLFYGRPRTLSKFKVLELVARVPYQAWEQVGYVAMTHVSARPGFARRVFDTVLEARAQQDNEQWHLLIIQELLLRDGVREGRLRFGVLPQLGAFLYYHASWLLFAVDPRLSYELNADLEDHAEHEYAEFVREHPEFESRAFDSGFARDYGEFASLADVFRSISLDERRHKLESLARARAPRFGAQ